MTRRFDKGLLTKPYAANPGVMFNGKIIIRPDRLDIPLKRKKPTVYAIWNDLLHPKVPFEFVAQAMDVICDERCEEDTFLLVTQRVERWKDFRWWHSEHWSGDSPFSVTLEALAKILNFWIIPTICNQKEADRIIPELLQIDEVNRGISIEPMLGAISFRWMKWISREHSTGHLDILKDISVVILGGETLGNRPGWEMKLEWVESIAGQCKAAGVPLFVKQLHINGKVSKDINEWPIELQRRELPWLQKDR